MRKPQGAELRFSYEFPKSINGFKSARTNVKLLNFIQIPLETHHVFVSSMTTGFQNVANNASGDFTDFLNER